MLRTSQVIAVAVSFVWLGMVLAISFVETPLKFRAPGITLPLGLGIGQLVFRALNLIEIALAVVLIAAGVAGGIPVGGWVLVAVVVAVLAAQVLAVRPRLDRRTVQVLAGRTPPPSRQHLTYIALEVVKVLALPALGAVLATRVVT